MEPTPEQRDGPDPLAAIRCSMTRRLSTEEAAALIVAWRQRLPALRKIDRQLAIATCEALIALSAERDVQAKLNAEIGGRVETARRQIEVLQALYDQLTAGERPRIH